MYKGIINVEFPSFFKTAHNPYPYLGHVACVRICVGMDPTGHATVYIGYI